MKSPRASVAGQSLLEVLIGLSIGAIIIGAAVFTIGGMLRSTTVTQQNRSASLITQDLLDRARSFFSESWRNFSTVSTSSANHYFLNASGSMFLAVKGEEGVWDNDVSSGLIGQWKLDEDASVATSTYDGSGNGSLGILENGISAALPVRTGSSTCRISNCLQFNGGNYSLNFGNWVRIPYSSVFDLTGPAITLSAWVRPALNPLVGQYGGILRHNGVTAGYRLLHTTSGGLLFQIGSPTTYNLNSSKTLILNQWNYIAAVLENGTMKIYLNGVLDAQGTGPATLLPSAENFYIGVTPDYSSLNGWADDARIYSRALSSDEISKLSKASPFRRYFYVDDACRTNDASSTLAGVAPCGGMISDPATKGISVVTEWVTSGKTNQYTFMDYLTRWQNGTFLQNDWSGGPASDTPLQQPSNTFASSTNLQFASGTLRLKNL